MNLYHLSRLQKELDAHIESNQEFVETNSRNYAWTNTALLVELGELANELRFFKFWSKKRTPKDPEAVKEEYADCLHFALSLANKACRMKRLSDSEEINLFENVEPLSYINLNTHFNQLYYTVVNGAYSNTEFMLRLMVGLGHLIGLDEEGITNAYLDKHNKNYERQANNY